MNKKMIALLVLALAAETAVFADTVVSSNNDGYARTYRGRRRRGGFGVRRRGYRGARRGWFGGYRNNGCNSCRSCKPRRSCPRRRSCNSCPVGCPTETATEATAPEAEAVEADDEGAADADQA